MSTLSIYRDSLSLLTDLYELTMAYAYWKAGIADRQAVFVVSFREHPFRGGYTIAAGPEKTGLELSPGVVSVLAITLAFTLLIGLYPDPFIAMATRASSVF